MLSVPCFGIGEEIEIESIVVAIKDGGRPWPLAIMRCQRHGVMSAKKIRDACARVGHTALLFLIGLRCTRPTLDNARINIEEIQNPADIMIDEIVNGFGVVIESGHRR